MRHIVTAAAGMAIGLLGCAEHSAPRANAAIVALVGKSDTGERALVHWGPAAGSVAVRYPDGAEELLWFDRHARYRRGISGDVYAAKTFPRHEESERAFLTSEVRTLPSTETRISSTVYSTTYRAAPLYPIEVLHQRDGTIDSVRIGLTTLGDFTFSGRYATRWKTSDGFSFEAMEPVKALGRMEAPPRSPWLRAPVERNVDASVDGRPVTIAVDSTVEGLWVSSSFVRAVDAEDEARRVGLLSPGVRRLMPGRTAPVMVAKLRRVTIAGRTVDPVYARVTDDDSFDLRAGIGMFPDTAIAFAPHRVARLTKARCAGGVPYDAKSPTLAVPERGSKRSQMTALATAYTGPPLRASYDPELAQGRIARRCDARASPIAFGGRRFGEDTICSAFPRSLFADADLVIGLHSLRSDHLIVDTRSARVCW